MQDVDPERLRRIQRNAYSAIKLLGEARRKYLDDLDIQEPDIAQEVRDLVDEASSGSEPSAPPPIEEAIAETQTLSSAIDPVSQPPAERSPAWRLVLLFAANALVVLAYLNIPLLVARYRPLVPDFGWGAERASGRWEITFITPRGLADGKLRLRDEIIAINGDRRIRGAGLDWARNGIRSADTYSVTVRRHGEMERGTVETGQEETVFLRAGFLPESFPSRHVIVYLVSGLAFLLTAVVAAWRKPHDRLAHFTSFACLAQCLVLSRAPFDQFEHVASGWAKVQLLLQTILDGPHYVVACASYLAAFPTPGKRIYLRWLIAGLAILEVPVIAGHLVLLGEWRLAFLADDYPLLASLERYFGTIYLFVPFVVCVAICVRYWSMRDYKQRLQLRWILIGGLAGFLPFVSWRLVAAALDTAGSPLPVAQMQRLNDAGILCTIFIPISISYAILTRKLWGVRKTFYKGLQILLVKRFVAVVLVGPFGAVAYYFFSWDGSPKDFLLHSAALRISAIFCLLSWKFRGPLRDWAKRNAGELPQTGLSEVERLKKSLSECHRVRDLLYLLGLELKNIFKPESIQIFGRSSEDDILFCGYSENARDAAMQISVRHPIIRALEEGGDAVERGAGQSVLSRLREFLPADKFPKWASKNVPAVSGWMEDRGAYLVVSIREPNQAMMGVIVLGQRITGRRYTLDDRAFLRVIGSSAATSPSFTAARDQGIRICETCDRVYPETDRTCAEDGNTLDPRISLPYEFAHFQLRRVLGKGGMGLVFAALDTKNHRIVAAKMIRPDRHEHWNVLKRTLREAVIHARLKHPNVAAFYEFVEQPVLCIIMEYVEGVTLRDLLRTPISAADAARWCSEILSALAFMHRSGTGIIHRDLKPENVMIENATRSAKILDFGLAHPVTPDESLTQLSQPGAPPGTYNYMAPEQIRGERQGSVDLYAVALIAYELLTGKLPFDHASSLWERKRVLVQGARLLPVCRDEDTDLQNVFRRALELEPDSRYRTATELNDALVPLMAQYVRGPREETRGCDLLKVETQELPNEFPSRL